MSSSNLVHYDGYAIKIHPENIKKRHDRKVRLRTSDEYFNEVVFRGNDGEFSTVDYYLDGKFVTTMSIGPRGQSKPTHSTAVRA